MLKLAGVLEKAFFEGKMFAQIANARAEVFALLKLMDIFVVDKQAAQQKMACIMMVYMKFLHNRQQNGQNEWRTPFKSLKANALHENFLKGLNY